MVHVFWQGGVLICALVHQAQLEQCCFQQAFQEPYDRNHHQLHIVSHFMQKVDEVSYTIGINSLKGPQSITIIGPIETTFTMSITRISFAAIMLNTLSSSWNHLRSWNI